MSYNYSSFKDISNDDITVFIYDINDYFNTNLLISTNTKTDALNRQKNVEVLCDWLNNRNAYNIIKKDTLSTEDIDNFIANEHAIQVAIDKAKNALNEAIQLIENHKHPVLQNPNKLIIPDAPLMRKHQKQFIENEELYEYIDKFAHKFTSKHSDFLMINEPNDFDKAVNEWQYYNKYPMSIIIKRDIPLTTYYFNQVGSLNDIFDCLHNVYKKEVKPFKIHFQLSGVFETYTYNFDTLEEKYEYKAQDIIWKNYKSMIPIIITNYDDLEIVKLYIESVLHSYETESSNTKLILVGSICDIT
ncbi:hypothetical protein M9Y10_031286 [Tritrichomonas musculus]|uniref:Uncharacterized protein n=1 Tax=Tritrichomonas musculus TaxID=1915356 RepID=A0ABR2H266_9EUKA